MHQLTRPTVEMTLALGYGSPSWALRSLIRACRMCPTCAYLTEAAVIRDLYDRRDQYPWVAVTPKEYW